MIPKVSWCLYLILHYQRSALIGRLAPRCGEFLLATFKPPSRQMTHASNRTPFIKNKQRSVFQIAWRPNERLVRTFTAIFATCFIALLTEAPLPVAAQDLFWAGESDGAVL